MKKVLFITLCVLFALAGCSKEQKSEELPEFVEVVIELPEIIKVNEEVVIEAHIKQGNEKVEDAQKVEFELWKSDQETHEKILGDHQGDGIYSISKTFLKEGGYFVIAHVTARDMHNMPKKEFTVTKIAE
ncbi:FixH family protein [Neobacillus sp. 179-C4.2 HS]|uniref:FixH family protein n=1 Tax=Neobacillus driksii TaxID=3035913 RepID=A0ABV4YSG9_9BACI|nr:FixH family protein [Neobacillus sp. 179.-C4.2 HS]MDP5194205.1 FixH family protein [Neobacillus sp. 179.-C4.2 HS]